jgi:hypothetical protein
MKLASFHHQGRDRIGFAFGDDTLVDLAEVATAMSRRDAPGDMIALIEAGEAGLKLLGEAADFIARSPGKVSGLMHRPSSGIPRCGGLRKFSASP